MNRASEQQLERGQRAHQQGRWEEAILAYRQALALDPLAPKPSIFLASALMESGHPLEALPLLQAACSRHRHNAPLLAHLAQAYFATAQYDAALDAFKKVLRIDPANPHYQLGLANSMALKGQSSEAQRLLEKLVTHHPGFALAWFNLGNVRRDLGVFELAAKAFEQCLKITPQSLEARNGLGCVLHQEVKLKEAEKQFRLCLNAEPRFLLARQNLVSVLMDLGEPSKAQEELQICIQLDPLQAHHYLLLADTFNSQGRLFEALQAFQSALRFEPENESAKIGLAFHQCAIGQTAIGFQSLGQLLQEKTAASSLLQQLRQQLSTLFLAHGFLAEGWAHYRHRQAYLDRLVQYPNLPLEQTLALDLTDQRVCVLSEQGLGDELFFLRQLPALKQRGATIMYRSSVALLTLLQRVSDIDCLLPPDAPLPAYDHLIMAGDLPHALSPYQEVHLNTDLPILPIAAPTESPTQEPSHESIRSDDFPWTSLCYSPLPAPSLRVKPLEAQTNNILNLLSHLGPPPYLGLTWRGGTPPAEQGAGGWLLFKSMPLTLLAPALRDYPGTLISLQRKPTPDEIQVLSALTGRTVHDFTHFNNDLEAMLALLALLDDYVGVSNTNMHLRAMVGRPARVLIPAPAEWRWMYCEGTSPWFPHFTPYRQNLQGDWDEALACLKNDLGPLNSSSLETN